MKEQKMYDAITGLSDELIEEAAFSKQKKKRYRRRHIPAVAAMLALCVIIGVLVWPKDAHKVGDPLQPSMTQQSDGTQQPSAAQKPIAVTPAMKTAAAYLATYPARLQAVDYGNLGYEQYERDVRNERISLRLPSDFDKTAINNFTRSLVQQLTSGTTGENRVFSPINVYMALSVLAETAGSNTRAQILEALGVSDIEFLRAKANIVWNNLYCDDGKTSILLANSLWLRDDTQYNEQTIKTIGDNYYASTFSGQMGSDTMNSALRDWINENTKGLLSDQIEGLELGADTVMSIMSTIYYKSKWSNEFQSAKNTRGTFYGISGEKEVTFMNDSRNGTYYWSENFAATVRSLNQGGMWLVLPDEGVSPEQLFEDESFWDLVQGGGSVENKYLKIDLSLPKFDITDETDMKSALMKLGVTDVFDRDLSDLSPLTEDWEEVWVSEVMQGTRLMKKVVRVQHMCAW